MLTTSAFFVNFPTFYFEGKHSKHLTPVCNNLVKHLTHHNYTLEANAFHVNSFNPNNSIKLLLLLLPFYN